MSKPDLRKGIVQLRFEVDYLDSYNLKRRTSNESEV
jgi:hypothetical protein